MKQTAVARPVRPAATCPQAAASAAAYNSKWANQSRRSRNEYGGGRSAGPLTNAQKAALCMLCREAFDIQGGARRLGTSLDEWRHEIVASACGKPGLTACTQEDYKPIAARFLDLKGEAGRAMNAHLDAESEPVRIARYKLREALAKKGLSEAYVGAICRRRFKCELAQCSSKQVWQLIFTINNRSSTAS